LKFRVPADLREHLQRCAARNMRSLNAEIIARLEASREADGKTAFGKLVASPDGDLVAALAERVASLETQFADFVTMIEGRSDD